MPLPNIERTGLRHHHNLSYLPGDEELARPAPPVPPPSFAGPSSSSQPSCPDYPDIDLVGLASLPTPPSLCICNLVVGIAFHSVHLGVVSAFSSCI